MAEQKDKNILAGWTKLIEKGKGSEMKYFFSVTVVLLYMAAFLCGTPGEIWKGMIGIVRTRDALITDYIAVAGAGACFMNAALVSTIGLAVTLATKIPFTGPSIAALFINIGYAFWGKNVVNILPVLFGTFLYAKSHHLHFGRYIYTALFGTCLAPFVTEVVYLLPFGVPVNIVFAVLAGIASCSVEMSTWPAAMALNRAV